MKKIENFLPLKLGKSSKYRKSGKFSVSLKIGNF